MFTMHRWTIIIYGVVRRLSAVDDMMSHNVSVTTASQDLLTHNDTPAADNFDNNTRDTTQKEFASWSGMYRYKSSFYEATRIHLYDCYCFILLSETVGEQTYRKINVWFLALMGLKCCSE